MAKNKHGLIRNIPNVIKRKVRKRCGFGCVVCGTAIVEYHHFEPEYSEAKEHKRKDITLLCPTCHSKVDKKIFDLDFIKKSDNNPKCKQVGFTKDVLYVGNEIISFKMGSASFKRLVVVIYDGTPLIYFSPPEYEGGPLRLNATIYDKTGEQLLRIEDNEWKSGIEHYDLETQSKYLIIREKKGDVKLKLSIVAEKEISIEKMDMNYKGFRVKVEGGQFKVQTPKGGHLNLICPNIYATLRLGSDGSVSL